MLKAPYNFLLYGFAIILGITALIAFISIVKVSMSDLKGGRQSLVTEVIRDADDYEYSCGGINNSDCPNGMKCVLDDDAPYAEGLCLAED